jgi:hypothetical protein
LFPPNIWNVYERTLIAEDRTNNHAEAAHHRLQTELGVDHPSIWKFIDGLKKVQKSRDVYMEQLMAGQLPPIKLKKFRDADERILKIVRDFGIRSNIVFTFNSTQLSILPIKTCLRLKCVFFGGELDYNS